MCELGTSGAGIVKGGGRQTEALGCRIGQVGEAEEARSGNLTP